MGAKNLSNKIISFKQDCRRKSNFLLIQKCSCYIELWDRVMDIPMKKRPTVSFVVLTYNTRDLIVWCLDRLLPVANECPCEIIVVDNGSKDSSDELIKKKYPHVQLIVVKDNRGFGGGNNLGLKAATGKYIVLLNSDAYIHPGSLTNAVQWMDANPQAGLAGAKLVNEDGSWQPYARHFPSIFNDFLVFSGVSSKFPDSRIFGKPERSWAQNEDTPAEVDWVTGAFAIARKDVLDKVGNFDERFYLYYEEVDLCRRIKEAGYTVWTLPQVIVTHLGGRTCNNTKVERYRLLSCFLYYRKHHGYIKALESMLLFKWWHRARIWKNQLFSTQGSEKKIQESKETIELINHAWDSTSGGKISPPKPW